MRVVMLLSCFLIGVQVNAGGMCPCNFEKTKDSGVLKYEIGLNAYTNQEALFNFWAFTPFHYYNTVPGLRFKMHNKNWTYRASLDHLNNTYKLEDTNPLNYQLITGKSQMNVLRMGVEKTVVEKPFIVYTAADLVYANAQYSGNDQGYGDFIWWGWNRDYKFKAHALGISPALGIKFHPVKHWSIGFETQLNLLYYKTYQYSADNYKDNGIALMFNPIGSLNLNYHFNLK